MVHIIPAIDIRNGRCVRLEQGDFNRQTVYDGAPVEVARRWEQAGAKEIHIVDLDGAKSGAPKNLDVVQRICAAVSCACELGGGIRAPADIRAALAAGAKRVVIGTTLTEQPARTAELLAEFNVAQLVAGLDARSGRIAAHGWQSESSHDLLAFARELFRHGMRNFIYTDIATDGMFTGPNLQQVAALCDALPGAQIIASGGVGGVEHVEKLVALRKNNLYGVIVGKALYDGRVTVEELIQASREASRKNPPPTS